MKIAYVTTYDSSDIHSWSGVAYYMLRTLQNCGFQTEPIGNLRDKAEFLCRMKENFYCSILSKTYHREREPVLLKYYATQLERALETVNCDIVFSPGTIPIAYLQTEKPIVFWTDATFAGMIDYYPYWCNLCAETIKNGNHMEQLALSKCRLAIYCSEWAANTAIQNYDVDPSKVKVVPFGGNLDCKRDLQQIDLIIKNKSFDTCKLLFIGAEWFRKGGDIALAVADLLNQRGVKTELHLVGDSPSGSLPGFAIKHGFISKKTETGRSFYDKLMTESHFLILPSRAECFGVVFAEASSFGLPSLATNVGGIPSAIQDGKNGQTFLWNESPEKYCDYIERFLSSRQQYSELARSSFREYSERLNWLSAGKQVSYLLQEFCG